MPFGFLFLFQMLAEMVILMSGLRVQHLSKEGRADPKIVFFGACPEHVEKVYLTFSYYVVKYDTILYSTICSDMT